MSFSKITKKKQKKHWYFFASFIVVVLLLGFGLVKAQFSFSDEVARWTGYFNSEKMDKAGMLNSPSGELIQDEETFGGAHAATLGERVVTADIYDWDTYATSTIGQIQHAVSGEVRYVTGAGFIFGPDDTTGDNSSTGTFSSASRVFDIVTSTVSNTTNTAASAYIAKAVSFTPSSTQYRSYTTSTVSGSWDSKNIWKYGEYIVAKLNTAVSSTVGTFFVKYIVTD